MMRQAMRLAAWCGALGVAASVLVWDAAVAQADETHYENFRFGQTAIGFGGAVTGFLSEPEASFYNPGGLGFLEDSKFSGGINFLGRDRRIIRQFISTDEEDVPSKDARARDVLALPNSSSVIKTFFGGRHAVGFSTFLTSNTQERFEGSLTLDFGDGVTRIGQTESLSDRMVLTGPSYAMRVNDKLGVGVSVFYARRTFSVFDQITERNIAPELGEESIGYTEVQERVDTRDGSLLMRLGAMWRVNSRWSLGAVVGTPSVHLHSRGSYNFRFINAVPSDLVDEDEEDIDRFFEINLRKPARTEFPWMFGLGASYAVPGAWRVAVGVNAYMPLYYERVTVEDEETAADNFASFVPFIDRELTINASVGAEVYLAQRWPMRLGLFTNHASSPEIVEVRSSEPSLNHVDLYGGAISIGYEDDKASINFGFEMQAGRGHEVTLDSSIDFEDDPFFRRRREQYRGFFFISGALSFVGNKAKNIIEHKAPEESGEEP